MKGSTISGDLGEMETSGVGRLCGVGEKGCEERRRIACVIVGWKRPPWMGEYALRWVGRTWPTVKKVERNLQGASVSRIMAQGIGWRTCFESRCRNSPNSIYDSRD